MSAISAMRKAVARHSAQIRQLEHDNRPFRRLSEAGIWETVAVTLAKAIPDNGHESIGNTPVRAHVSASRGKGGLFNATVAARGAGTPLSLAAWRLPSDARRFPPDGRRSGGTRELPGTLDPAVRVFASAWQLALPVAGRWNTRDRGLNLNDRDA